MRTQPPLTARRASFVDGDAVRFFRGLAVSLVLGVAVWMLIAAAAASL